ncbi:hypothetical protein A6A04_18925 [Paramagnetospirillum marisnigri]|uniref:Core-binding (CB) domain-containing protein n=1 Tax=Paramagnetospirillum marisnigri TaxID=1285242 RepID=A0A178MLR1_9PROT|nr:site-specific integrase [Paramagnetospirillum marisnigri]OAN49646.1 hypothetical protein A6A04_18925 [Paramagnetospirillum marisnigri]
MKEMPSITVQTQRGRFHYYQRRVPQDILRNVDADTRASVLGTSSAMIKRYLGDNKREALKKAAELWGAQNDLFDQLRGKGTSKPTVEVTDAVLEAIAWRVFKDAREALEEGARSKPTLNLVSLAEGFEITTDPWRDGLNHDDWSRDTLARVAYELRQHDIELPEESPRFIQARGLIATAILEAHKAALGRIRGEPEDATSLPRRDPGAALVAPPDDDSLPVTEIHRRWEVERAPQPRTAMEWKTTFTLFVQVVGDKPVAQVTGVDVRAFKDALLLMPTSMTKRYPGRTLPEVVAQTQQDDSIARVTPATIGKYLNALKSVFAWAVANSYVPSNPASGITVNRKGGSKTRLSFNADDLAKLFGSPIYTANERPRAAGGEAAKWLPLLGLFTGARLEELGQSLASDIRYQDGIWYIDINELDHRKSLKTQGSRRQIPLHPNLIRCGFLGYVAQCQGGSLFPLLKPDQYGKITGNWSKWFNRYKRDVGVIIPPKAMKDFHSFRHGFKDACRAARIGEEVHDALTGHTGGGIGRRYGSEKVPLDVKAEAIAKVWFEVDLDHLYGGVTVEL